ncbi:MAG: hypothetical protein ABI823_20475 [Bryobacteraceae bacterium]
MSRPIPTAKKLAPVLIVDEIEACEPFWLQLGYTRTVEVPHAGKLGFIILANGAVEIMYQSRASVAGDVPALADGTYRAALFIEVDSLDAVIANLGGAPIVFERRTTFYGADEIGVLEPGGSPITFAEFRELPPEAAAPPTA